MAMSLKPVDFSTRYSRPGSPVFMLNVRTTETIGSVWLVPPSRSARYRMPLTMSLPSGSFRTSGGVLLARCGPGVAMPIQRAVCTEPSWLRNEIQALFACTFCGTPRFGTTITPRSGSYEQLSAE